jgi:hypothetical protein
MRLKSAYRKPADSNSAETPAPSEKLHVELPDDATTVDAAIEPAPPADEATVALMRQLDSLQKGDELQKQYAMHQHAVQASQRQQPMTRAEFLRSQGLTPLEAQFFDSREDMMANQQEASEAAAEALAAGIERDSPQFFEAVEEGFAKRLDQRAAEQTTPAPAPAFFAPRPAPSPAPAAPDRSGMYSAPVSRGTPSGETGQRPARTIRLTAEEREYARVAGISDVEYARQKQKLAQAKAAGDYGERR